MIESVGVSMNLKCANCNGPVHLPGMVQRLVCPHCGQKVQAQWKGLGRDVLLVAGGAPGAKGGYTFFSGKGQGRFDFQRRRPRCPECRSDVDIAGLTAEEPTLRCAQGHPVRARPAEALARRMLPGAAWIVGEGVVAEAGDQKDTSLLLLNCKACGGELEIQPTRRDLTCGYCSSLNAVPDEVWIRLHPELQPREFFVLARWGPADVAARQGALAVWHDKQPKERAPLYSDEDAIASGWPAPEQDGLDWLTSEMTTGEREDLATRKRLHALLVLRLARDPKVPVRQRLADSPSLTPEAQQVLARDPNADVRRRLAERKDLGPEAAEALIDAGETALLGALEGQSGLSVSVRLALARAGRPAALRALELRDVSPDHLEALAAHAADPEARVLVARHPQAPAALLEPLARDPSPEVRAALASRPDLAEEVVQELFTGGDPSVRAAIAARSELPAGVRLALARDDEEQLAALLLEDDCPEGAFPLALASDSGRIHQLAIGHSRVPEAVLVGLAAKVADEQSRSDLICRERTPALRDAMVRSPSVRLRDAVVEDPLAPAQLELLAADSDRGIRLAIAARPDLPAPAALRLAGDEDPEVRAAVAAHPAAAAARFRRRLKIAAVVLAVGALLTCAGTAAALALGVAGGLSAVFG